MPVLQFVQQLYSPGGTTATIVESALRASAAVSDPLANAKFRLNSLGVAGFFGGDIAVNGMATVIFFWRGWGGLHNTPGSLEIARRYGQLAGERIYRGLFPGNTRDPSRLFGPDGQVGPKFLGAHSGSLFEKTGHIGYLVARLARREHPEAFVRELVQDPPQRVTTPATVTVIDLTRLDDSKLATTIHPKLPYPSYGFFSLIPAAVSFLACVACASVGDWWTFSIILWGMLANGCACFVLGQGKVTFQHPEPAPDAPPGDGILWAAENAVVVIRGSERAVNMITRGRFFLEYNRPSRARPANGPSQRPDGPPSQTFRTAQRPTPGSPHAHDTTLGIELDTDDGASTPLLPPAVPLHSDNAAPENELATGNGVPVEDEVERKEGASRDLDSAPEGGVPNSLLIGISGILLIIQFFAQLLLIPQVGLFGQVMFLLTVAASWGYNVLISSIDREDIQVHILRGPDILNLKKAANVPAEEGSSGQSNDDRQRGQDGQGIVRKFEFGTWTAMATFACLALRTDSATPLRSSSKILDALIPNDTDVWVQWKKMVKTQLASNTLSADDLSKAQMTPNAMEPVNVLEMQASNVQATKKPAETAPEVASNVQAAKKPAETAEVAPDAQATRDLVDLGPGLLRWIVNDARVAIERYLAAFPDHGGSDTGAEMGNRPGNTVQPNSEQTAIAGQSHGCICS